MPRLSVPLALRVLLLSCAALAFGAQAALATTITYSADGSTLIVTSVDNANHEVQFRLSADNAHDEIIDTVAFTSIPADCVPVVDPTWISCPAHLDVQVDLGAGSDRVFFTGPNSDCFVAYAVNLGDGANTLNLSDACPPIPASTATVTSGSGHDDLAGGAQSAITFFAGDGDDDVTGGSGADVVHGGDGADRLLGGAGDDRLLGEGGADTLIGEAGNDVVDGGDGDDALEHLETGSATGAGADAYAGGPGADTLWLDRHAGGMSITIDGQADDGAAGEGDDVGGDIEAIVGTPGNDAFTGSEAVDVFDGGAGSDQLHGAGGADDLRGGGGNDTLLGGAGDDRLQGDEGADTVDGGAGADQLYGDIAGCSVFCSFDSDTLLARDGERDAVDCGGGADTAVVDSPDVVAFCATVDRAAAPSAPAPVIAPPPAPFGVTFSATPSGKLKIGARLRVVVRCSAACRYKATVVLSAKTARRYGIGTPATTIATARGTLKAAGKKTAVLTLSAKTRRRLRRARTVPATLRLAVTNAAGAVSVKSRSVVLRR
jgi:Ca2+-binding RTX toxin-like protein